MSLIFFVKYTLLLIDTIIHMDIHNLHQLQWHLVRRKYIDLKLFNIDLYYEGQLYKGRFNISK
jgi:hypothetical protein